MTEKKIKLSRRAKKTMKKHDFIFWELRNIKNLQYEYHKDHIQLHFLKGAKS